MSIKRIWEAMRRATQARTETRTIHYINMTAEQKAGLDQAFAHMDAAFKEMDKAFGLAGKPPSQPGADGVG